MTFGEKLRTLMAEREIGLRELAKLVPYDAGNLSKVANDRKPPSLKLAERLDEILNANGELVALGPSMVPDRRHRHDDLRQDLDQVLSAGAMADAALDDWDWAVSLHGQAARDRAPGVMLGDLESDLHDLRRVMAQRRSPSTLRRLTRVAAHMSGLMCLTLIKLDDRAAFRPWARTGRAAARETGDSVTHAWVLAQEAYGHFYAGDHREAISVAQQAQHAASPSVGAVLAAALEARAYATLEARACDPHKPDTAPRTHAALRRAESMLSALPTEVVSTSAFGYSEAQLRFHEGNALTHLGAAAAAWPAQQRALALCAPDDYMDRTLTHLDRTVCLIRDGDVSAALEYAADALDQLDWRQREGIIITRGREVLNVLTPQQRALPAARQLREMLTPTPGREADKS